VIREWGSCRIIGAGEDFGSNELVMVMMMMMMIMMMMVMKMIGL